MVLWRKRPERKDEVHEFPVWNVHEAHGRSTAVGRNAPSHTQTIILQVVYSRLPRGRPGSRPMHSIVFFEQFLFFHFVYLRHFETRSADTAMGGIFFHHRCLLYMACFCLVWRHWWFSGRILACHAVGPGSIPGQCIPIFFWPFWQFFFWPAEKRVSSKFPCCWRRLLVCTKSPASLASRSIFHRYISHLVKRVQYQYKTTVWSWTVVHFTDTWLNWKFKLFRLRKKEAGKSKLEFTNTRLL